jgi:alpha-aminoadipic semialdehyde synthase
MTENIWSAISFFLSNNEPCKPHQSQQTALDLFSLLLSKRLKYDEGERDLVAMHHEFGVEHRSGKKVRMTANSRVQVINILHDRKLSRLH